MTKALGILLSMGFFFNAQPQPFDRIKSSKLHPKLKTTGVTVCGDCHTTTSWAEVIFDHERTGFPLRGAHVKTPCAGCHFSDFKRATPRTCAACHEDIHGGELGSRCEGCHNEKDWESEFRADAHRRTNFPLVGRHALLPCEACHAELPSRKFSRVTVECLTCHQTDFNRTNAVSISHATFSPNCRQCHNVIRFAPAIYPGHENNASGFKIATGPHAAIGCRDCHDTVKGASAANVKCTNCHRHNCPDTIAEHTPGRISGVNYNSACIPGVNTCSGCHPAGLNPLTVQP
ncbi:MAG: cytochrome C [Myxococcaceae bacterium]